MCGIFILLNGQVVNLDHLSKLFQLIKNRGPDYCSPLLSHSIGSHEFKLLASILHLRGQLMQQQPVIDDHNNVLLFNGQIYTYEGCSLDSSQSDTTFLVRKLKTCTTAEQVAAVFARIEGPFAFIYLHARSNFLIYGRDLFGRKSLCYLEMENEPIPIIISSIADAKLESSELKWSEVSCAGLHCIDLGDVTRPQKYTIRWNLDQIYPRTNKCSDIIDQSCMDKSISVNHLQPLNGDLRLVFEQAKIDEAINKLEDKFLRAVKSRMELNNQTCLACRRSRTQKCTDSKVAVAFSGGIDSTIIALALDKLMDKSESIDLITVAFKPDSPDRLSAGCAFQELVKISPHRNWRLIICDIAIQELQKSRDETIRNLILPCDSVFDDGIGCACWFVGRGTGRAIDKTTNQEWLTSNFESFLRFDPNSSCVEPNKALMYTCPASMLYIGSSIDEQLGGYSSHRAAWSKSGPKGLLEEVSFQMRRLSSRNLGRDDRAYSDHGRDLKLPFLDFEFVTFLNQLPMGLKMNLDDPQDIGPKKILRLLALRWGLAETGRRIKRAMQFGTRIANLENNKEKGNDVCVRLRSEIN